MIALIGQWRFREHRSAPEMHQALLARGVSITERSVTNLMQRYARVSCVAHGRSATHQHAVAATGARHSGHRWAATRCRARGTDGVVRDCLSGEILLARPLLSSTQGDLTTLLTEVKQQLAPLDVALKGVISDGEETIGSAVAFVFPEVPHQLCHFHYLKDAVDPLYEADRHAKTQLKKLVRGVRPLERALEPLHDPQADATRSYCLAVRSALTDDGCAPLEASGLKLQERLTLISDSLARVEQKKAFSGFKAVVSHSHQGVAEYCDPLSKRPMRLCIRRLIFWPIRNKAQERYFAFVVQMQEQSASLGELSTAIDHFVKITGNFAHGLFHCYDVKDLPQTNNDLEHCFGVARAHERRATGRRGAIPGVVVRSSVRLVAVLVSKQEDLQAADLQPNDYQQWRDLRAKLQSRQEARRQQFRFRKDPDAYLAILEAQLLE